MKKIVLGAIALLITCASYAQDFPVQWKSKFSFKPERWFYTGDGKYILGRSTEQAEVLDGRTGASMWKLTFKTDLNVKELARAVYNESEGIALFLNYDEKKKVGEKIIVDLVAGKELWRGDQYAGEDADGNLHFANSVSNITAKGATIVFNNTTHKFTGIDLHNGKVLWESKAYPDVDLTKHIGINSIQDSEYAQCFIYNDDVLKTQILYLNIRTGEELKDDSKFTTVGGNYLLRSSGKIRIKNTIGNTSVTLVGSMKKVGNGIKFEMKSAGDNIWSQDFESSAVREIFTDAPYVRLDIQGEKVFVIAKEIIVFDFKSGEQLWKAPFDNVDASAGLKATQEFGIAGWPLVVGNDIYYVDLKEDNAIRKVEGNTGKVIWKSPKFSSDDRVPNLLLIDGVLVAQFGGLINKQLYIPSSNGGATYKNENRFDGKYGVKAYDPASGKLLWETASLAAKLGDKFSERISSIYNVNNKILVASDKNVFSLEPKTGDVVYKTNLESSKIGDVFEVLAAEDGQTMHVYCDNGIASVNAATGKLNYATKTGEIFWKAPGSSSHKFNQGTNTFIWVGEADFIGFDFKTGTIKGKMEDNSDPSMTDDGNSIFVRDSEKVTRYSVNKQ